MADPRAQLSFRRQASEAQEPIEVGIGLLRVSRLAGIRDARIDEILSAGDQAIARGAVVRYRTFVILAIDDVDAAAVVYDNDGLSWDVYSVREGAAGEYMELLTKRVSTPPVPMLDPTQPPGSPIGVRVVNGNEEFTVHFHPPYGGDVRVTGYEISLDLGQSWLAISNPGVGIYLSVVVPGVFPGIEVVNGGVYVVVLRSVSVRQGEETLYSIPSELAYGRPSASVPDRPGAPTIEVLGRNSFRVSWEAPDDGGTPILYYNVRFREPVGEFRHHLEVDGLSGVLSGLQEDTLYSVQVEAVNAIGNSGYSAVSSERTAPPATVPGRMASPTFSEITRDSVRITWVPPADDGDSPILRYSLRRRIGTGPFEHTHNIVGSTGVLSGLDPNTTYRVSMRAVNAIGDGLYSPEATFTTLT